jgi:hypothetical protein
MEGHSLLDISRQVLEGIQEPILVSNRIKQLDILLERMWKLTSSVGDVASSTGLSEKIVRARLSYRNHLQGDEPSDGWNDPLYS